MEKEKLDRALIDAAARGKAKEAEKLLTMGADVNSRDNWGNTPLHGAVENASIKVIEYFLKAGADVNASNSVGLTPLIRAACRLNNPKLSGRRGKKEHETAARAIKLLLERGADPNARTKNGNTAKDLNPDSVF